MSDTMLAYLGIAAGVLQMVSIVPYLTDIFRGRTKPERATWWIWTLLTLVSLCAQIGAHAKWSLWMTAGQLAANAVIAVLSLTHGYGKFRPKDCVAIVVALCGSGLWYILKSPLAAIITVVIADLVGFSLTVEKTWRHPRTETEATWVVLVASSLLGVLAVGKFDFTLLLYPFYILCGNALMVAVIVDRRRRPARSRKTHTKNKKRRA